MTRKIFRAILLVSLVAILASAVIILGVLYSYFSDLSMDQLNSQLELAAQGVERDGAAYFHNLKDDNIRITWIASDGTVLYESSDTDAAQMENHLNREEVKEALKTGHGESSRYSSTRTEREIYVAKKLTDGSVLRMAVAQDTTLSLVIGMLQPVAAVTLLVILAAMFFASRVARRIVRPLNQLDLDHPLDNTGYDELSPILERIHSQQIRLRDQQNELADKQRELNTILENMSEGMILLNEKSEIFSINPAAMRLLDAGEDDIGRQILTVSRHLELQDLIESAKTGVRSEKVIDLKGAKYQVTASPIFVNGAVEGIAILMFDVTDREESEQIRREFSANVSHELKTPLHAISGYSELLRDGVVRPEDVQPFAEKIYDEAQRTIRLVEDILRLSHLDEGAGDLEWSRVEVLSLAKAAAERVEQEAKKRNVTVEVRGETAEMDGVRPLLQTMLDNLVENAVKYNIPDGRVEIEISSAGDKVVCLVRDTGIGIPQSDQKRIFERFYRVDKSHSRAIGGTGLGLSIVKHVILIHQGKINLQSEVGIGTSIRVLLPKTRSEKTGTPEGEEGQKPEGGSPDGENVVNEGKEGAGE